MEVSLKRNVVDGRASVAVYLSGRCVRSGLSEEAAAKVMAELLNSQFERANSP